MPVCVRDVGIFAGLALGGFIYSRRGVNRWTIRDTFLSILPDDRLQPVYRSNRRTRVFIAGGLICVVPLALDGFTQLLQIVNLLHSSDWSRVYRLALDSDSFSPLRTVPGQTNSVDQDKSSYQETYDSRDRLKKRNNLEAALSTTPPIVQHFPEQGNFHDRWSKFSSVQWCSRQLC